MTAQDWLALWEAGGPTLVGVVAVITAVVYDKKRPKPDDHSEALGHLHDVVADVSRKLDALRLEVTNRVGRVETRQDEQQRQIDRLDRRQ